MNSIFIIIKEQIEYRHLIWELSLYNMRSEYANHYLGLFWNILQPAMQLFTYWLVFGLGIRGGSSMSGDIEFIDYLIGGLFPWLFISQGINSSAGSIQAKLSLVTKMRFPSSSLISIAITNSLINLVSMTMIVVIVSVFRGYFHPENYLYFLYFIFASYLFIFAIGLLMSTLNVMIKDMRNVLQNVIRMLFFMSPIFWSVDEAHPFLQVIAALNPITYMIELYRGIFIYGEVVLSISNSFYFWTFTLTVLLIGARIHTKFKDNLIDYL